jgi:hypothetical protein
VIALDQSIVLVDWCLRYTAGGSVDVERIGVDSNKKLADDELAKSEWSC